MISPSALTKLTAINTKIIRKLWNLDSFTLCLWYLSKKTDLGNASTLIRVHSCRKSVWPATSHSFI
jgi:hypothetical protein